MKASHKKTTDIPAYKWGNVGGRGRHPADPTGAIFGDTHWPLSLQHEGGTSKKAPPRPVVKPATSITTFTPATPKKLNGEPEKGAPLDNKTQSTTSTGLETRDDFLKEAERVGVLTAELTTKIAKWFLRLSSGEVGVGMARMQCNLLIRNAIRRKEAG